jgi:hypothetical protein
MEIENTTETIVITTTGGEIRCIVTDGNKDGNMSYVAEIIYPDGYTVYEAIVFNTDTQQLEFDFWNTPYRDDHGEIEEKLCAEIMNRNL